MHCPNSSVWLLVNIMYKLNEYIFQSRQHCNPWGGHYATSFLSPVTNFSHFSLKVFLLTTKSENLGAKKLSFLKVKLCYSCLITHVHFFVRKKLFTKNNSKYNYRNYKLKQKYQKKKNIISPLLQMDLCKAFSCCISIRTSQFYCLRWRLLAKPKGSVKVVSLCSLSAKLCKLYSR